MADNHNVTVPAWAREQLALRDVMGRWIASSGREQRLMPYRGGKRHHDEGSFTAAWCGHHLLTGDPIVLEFMHWLRDEYLAYSIDHQVHGYDEWGEVHHQPEHYMVFLTRLWHLDKSDRRTIDALVDAAHHTGNWIPGVTPWYDWENHRFLSWSIGTRLVQDYPPYDFNVPDHFKPVQMALTAHLATGQDRYLDLCCDYADMWTGSILEADDDDPPCLLYNQELDRSERERLYGKHNARALRMYYDAPPSVRVEQHLAAASLEILLDLFTLTGNGRYVDAVRKLVPYIVEANSDPEVEMPAMFLTKYREATGDTSFDGQIGDQLEGRKPVDISRLVLLAPATHERNAGATGRMGWRQDSVRWGYQGDDGIISPDPGPSPSALMLGYAIDGDLSMATRALAVARRRMELATFVLRDGREHGCAAHSIHAVAAGHGRATGAGCVTTTLYPFALGSYRFCAAESPRVRYGDAERVFGLPDGAAARCWLDGDTLRVTLCNTRSETVLMSVGSPPEEPAISGASLGGAALNLTDDSSAQVAVPAEGILELALERKG